VALARARARNREAGLDAAEGRFEAETLDWHRAVREGYLALARADGGRRIRLVDAAGDADEVSARVVQALSDLFSAEAGA
jgi:dTMP kinase